MQLEPQEIYIQNERNLVDTRRNSRHLHNIYGLNKQT